MLLRTWLGISELRLDEISMPTCKEWAAKINSEIASHYYNNFATLRW